MHINIILYSLNLTTFWFLHCTSAFTKNKNFFFQVESTDTENIPLQLVQIPKCSNPCPLDDFIKLTKSVISEDIEKECSYLTPDYNTILF